MKIRFLAIALIVFAAIQAYAGGTSCATATSLVPDGRLLDFDNVQPQPNPPQPNGGNWYQFTATAGRSYSVEVRDDVDPDNPDLTVTYYGPNSTCANLQTSIPTTVATVTDTHATEPAVTGTTKRVSIVTSATGGGTYWIQVQNTNASLSHYVSIGVTETTIYGSEWDTFGNLTTQFYFQNTTSQTLAYTFTMVSTAGGSGGSATTSGNLSPASTPSTACASSTVSASCVSPNIATMGISGGQVGYSILVHNGPPGAIQAFQFWACYSCTPVVIVPVPMGTLRGK